MSASRCERCRRRRSGNPQLHRQVKLNPPLGGELSGDGGGDGGGDGPTVVAEADLEVPGVVRIDAAGGDDVAESFDGVHPLAGTGVAGVDAGRQEAIRHRTVTCPTLATGRSAAVGGREVGPLRAGAGTGGVQRQTGRDRQADRDRQFIVRPQPCAHSRCMLSALLSLKLLCDTIVHIAYCAFMAYIYIYICVVWVSKHRINLGLSKMCLIYRYY